MERIGRGELTGFPTTHVLSDVAHRLMALEAMTRFSWSAKGIAQRLAQHPKHVQQLVHFRSAVEMIPQLGVQVAAITPAMPAEAAGISQQYGLLSGDALIVVFMRKQGILNLASHDADFDCVPTIKRFSPA